MRTTPDVLTFTCDSGRTPLQIDLQGSATHLCLLDQSPSTSGGRKNVGVTAGPSCRIQFPLLLDSGRHG